MWSTSWDDERIWRVVSENRDEAGVVSDAACCRLLRIMRGEYEEKFLGLREELLEAKRKTEMALYMTGANE